MAPRLRRRALAARALFVACLLLSKLAAAKRHRSLESFYSIDAEVWQAWQFFPWMRNYDAWVPLAQKWGGSCDIGAFILPGESLLQWRNLLDIIYIVEGHYRDKDGYHSEKELLIGGADFDEQIRAPTGHHLELMNRITGLGQQSNPFVASCPVAVTSALVLAAFWSYSGQATWEDTNRVVGHLAASRELISLLRSLPEWVHQNSRVYEGWIILADTTDYIRRKVLCWINELDMPGVSAECRSSIHKLREVVLEVTQEDYLVCGAGGLHGGSIQALQSIIRSSGSEGSKGGGKTYCEVGFNFGMSSTSALCMPEVLRAFAWDIGAVPGAEVYGSFTGLTTYAGGYMRSTHPESCRITFGDSLKTLPKAGAVLGGRLCDFVFIDGSHDPEVVLEDLLSFMNVSSPGAVFVLDDCWTSYDGGGELAHISDVASWAARALRLNFSFSSTADGHCVLRRMWGSGESPSRPRLLQSLPSLNMSSNARLLWRSAQ
ncbi:unnamed protein product [Polarella glacialis]|uniref:Uncharacterized protein n=1 Tax=Polarella glacialis TaxID=89957 RepID=A0A813ISW4_POLGL|nr:unnamed protein product [Polarella glacialis]